MTLPYLLPRETPTNLYAESRHVLDGGLDVRNAANGVILEMTGFVGCDILYTAVSSALRAAAGNPSASRSIPKAEAFSRPSRFTRPCGPTAAPFQSRSWASPPAPRSRLPSPPIRAP